MTNNLYTVRRLRAGSALHALALMGAGIGVMAMATPAAAQDYTSGAVSGTVATVEDSPVVGAQVTLRSQAQNQSRTLTTSSGGSFTAAGLTPGVYDVTVSAEGYRNFAGTVTVVATQQNRVTLTLTSVNAPADIVVTGQRVRQDFTKTSTGLNIDVTALTANAPIVRSITALTLLAPGAIRGAAGFTNSGGESVPSISGSSVAENAYYINGLNITNPDTYVGSTRVPFDFYNTVDIQTGGY